MLGIICTRIYRLFGALKSKSSVDEDFIQIFYVTIVLHNKLILLVSLVIHLDVILVESRF